MVKTGLVLSCSVATASKHLMKWMLSFISGEKTVKTMAGNTLEDDPILSAFILVAILRPEISSKIFLVSC